MYLKLTIYTKTKISHKRQKLQAIVGTYCMMTRVASNNARALRKPFLTFDITKT